MITDPTMIVAGDVAAGTVTGLLAGIGHFWSLRRNLNLFAAGRAVPAFGLQLARIALNGVVLAALAHVGALTLLCGMLGWLAARQRALHEPRAPR